MTIKTQERQLGDDVQVTYTSDSDEGMTLDTHVEIQGKSIAWISGDKITEFHMQLEEIVAIYRI